MKLLYLVRHATAEEGSHSPMFRDFDRQLISRGISEAARMGSWLASNNHIPQQVISSEALRAKETAEVLLEQFKQPQEALVLNENLYAGGPRAYLAALNGLSEEVESVAIVGHNPDITFFAEYLTRDDTGGSMKKSGVIILSFEAATWAEISGKMGKFVQRIDPADVA